MNRRDALIGLSGTAILTTLGHRQPARGQPALPAFPTGLVRIVVPFTPGAVNDTLARILAKDFQERLGHSAIVENKAGGGTLIGTLEVARAAPDGHTLLLVALPFAVLPGLFPKAGVRVPDGFAPVSLIGTTPNMLVVKPSLGVATVEELIAWAKREPGRLNYASAGNGSSPHLAMELFKIRTGTEMTHVPYRGAAPATLALISGEADLMINNAPNVIEQVNAGQLKALAVTAAERTPFAPGVPTIAEAGVADFDITSWYGLVAPTGTSRPVLERIAAEVRSALSAPAAAKLMEKLGIRLVASGPAEFSAFLHAEVERWTGVIKAAGIRAS